MMGAWRNSIAVALAGLALAACSASGSIDRSTPNGSAGSTTLTVLGAASLSTAFPRIGALFTKDDPGIRVRCSFAGTDQLAAQIEQGAPADVFAGASTTYGDRLSAEGLIGAPTAFATNRLVVIVPASNPAGVASAGDLSKAGAKVVIGATSVPIGAYTRTVLANLDAVYGSGYASAVLANVVSEEDSVTSIVSKVQLGEADAGFVYVTDAIAAGPAVTAVPLPPDANATATYPIAVVRDSGDASAAARFVDFVLSPSAQAILRAAGFGPPPS